MSPFNTANAPNRDPVVASNVPFIFAVCVMIALGAALSIGIILLRPQADPLAVCASVFGLLSSTTLSLLAFMKSQQTHLSVNSRLDDFISTSSLAAHAEGQAQGMKEGMAIGKRLDNPPSQKGE